MNTPKTSKQSPANKKTNLPLFGKRDKNHDYRKRPGAYAIVLNADSHIGILEDKKGAGFLPGGGIDPGETPEEALRREVIEECGFAIRIHRKICEAVEFFQAQNSGKHFEVHGHYYEISFENFVGGVLEDDHVLVWLEPEEAGMRLCRAGQAWAVRKMLESA